MLAYHDEEWGVPVWDDDALFERLMLECFQAGLSWRTILHRRDSFHRAFDGWNAETIANYGPDDHARLLADPGSDRKAANEIGEPGLLRRHEIGQRHMTALPILARDLLAKRMEPDTLRSPLLVRVDEDVVF